ncbi:hypothetical protein FF098_014240 [Parvularcula flava]|uniref:Type II secretion system protein L n=1 Tax=Aquisalinus luteolus TaxID=1566827 RepID=A0A8J3A3J3_9PROT|nr:type II secretion system protein GspL [Aquisalinus luteolus]NHK29079.1 hypothetical protein [Aquisalinus luteolus]GGI00376.1 hypothetical protein GCM10011355_28520 [Aquisalinus luteolus]
MRLILITGDTIDDPLSWVETAGDKPVAGGVVASLAGLAEAVEGDADEIVVILPGERFAIRRLTTPARNQRQLLQAARFLLEDELAGPVESLHISLGADAADSAMGRPIIAVDEAWVAGWLEALREAGFPPDILTADILALGVSGQSIMLVEKDRLRLNMDGEGFVTDRPLADELATEILSSSGIQKLGVIRLGDAVPVKLPEDIAVQEITLPDARHLPAFMVGHMVDNQPVNLLQGTLERGLDWRAALKPWRYAAGLAAACLALWLVTVGIEAMQLHDSAQDLQRQAQAEFAATWPDLPQRNIANQARQLAAEGGASETWFLELSSVLANAMEERSGVQLAAVTYDATEGLVADIRFLDTEELDRLKQSLSAYGIVVEEGRNLSRDSDNAYIGKLYLRTS